MDVLEFNKKVRLSLFIPLLLTVFMWLVKSVEWLFETNFASLGVQPRSFRHLYGVFLSPFIHSNWEHLWANTIPFFVLSWALFFFYRTIATRTFLWMYVGSGLLLWLIGRNSYHIGMSGTIYALASFLMVSGLVKGNYRLTALSLIVIFSYGSFFWGLFPIEERISWEGHLSGALVGFLLALFYKEKGPQPPQLLSEDDDSIPEEIWNAQKHQNAKQDDSFQ